MRKDDFSRRQSRYARRDIFSERRRTGLPWGWLVLIPLVIVGGLLLSQTRFGGDHADLWSAIQGLWQGTQADGSALPISAGPRASDVEVIDERPNPRPEPSEGALSLPAEPPGL